VPGPYCCRPARIQTVIPGLSAPRTIPLSGVMYNLSGKDLWGLCIPSGFGESFAPVDHAHSAWQSKRPSGPPLRLCWTRRGVWTGRSRLLIGDSPSAGSLVSLPLWSRQGRLTQITMRSTIRHSLGSNRRRTSDGFDTGPPPFTNSKWCFWAFLAPHPSLA
jgi:hypothetical protein